MFENYSASCYIWIFHTCVDTYMAPCHDMSSAVLVYSIMPSESKIRYYPTGSTLNHSAPGGGGLEGITGDGNKSVSAGALGWPFFSLTHKPRMHSFTLWEITYSHNRSSNSHRLYLGRIRWTLNLDFAWPKPAFSTIWVCTQWFQPNSIPMAWISFGNRVHFPLFFTSSLNISQTYFGKIVLRMIETVRRCQQCWDGFYKKQTSKETFWFHFPCTSFQNSKRFWSLAAFPCCPQATQKERSERYIWYCTSCDFLQRPMLQQIWVNSHPCIIFLTLFSLTFWPAGLRALVLRIKQICKTEIQRAS